MLFALDWMKKTWDAMVSAIRTLTEGLDLSTVSAAICDSWLVLITGIIMGIVLCLFGFRYHKFVHGIVGSMLLGALGWNIGEMINPEQIGISVIYAILLAIAGFFVLYLCYFFNVLVGGYLFFLAALAPFRVALQDYALIIAVLFAVLYCAFYIKYKLAMTAVTGAIVLGLMFFDGYPAIAAIVVCINIAAGIYVQLVLRRHCDNEKMRSMQRQLKKYPYGPGLVYGWKDPTLVNTTERNERS